jgi:hypothetical protein
MCDERMYFVEEDVAGEAPLTHPARWTAKDGSGEFLASGNDHWRSKEKELWISWLEEGEKV